MNKQDLVKHLSEESELTKGQVESVLNALEGAVEHSLRTDGEVVLPGIGKLKLSERAARTGRNPKTGEALEIAASTSVKLSVAKALKDAVNA